MTGETGHFFPLQTTGVTNFNTLGMRFSYFRISKFFFDKCEVRAQGKGCHHTSQKIVFKLSTHAHQKHSPS